MAVERTRRRRLAIGLLLLAAALGIDAGWVHAKAGLAQWLLLRAWDATVAGGGPVRPWPGADLRPVAVLAAPRLGVRQLVVAGDSGRAIAFGPGWAEASAALDGVGTRVISGHRDTHFAWLRGLEVGDLLMLDHASGLRRFRVDATTVADVRTHRLALDGDADRLLLVTCWPFDAVIAGGPQRYVVSASAID